VPPVSAISYDATSGVQMQVHLHRANDLCDRSPRNGARGIAQFQVDGGGKTGGWVGVPPQKEMNDGSGAKRRAALAAESREMAKESSQ
jgi:hypothetical protein